MEALLIKSFSGSVADIDDKGVIVKAVNAFNVRDAAGDISLKGSFTKTLKEGFGRVRWYLNHNQEQLLGVPIEGTQTDTHLVMKSRINLNKQIGRDTYEDYKMYASEGKSLEHSVGVIAMPGKFERKADARYVSEWRLMEYSTLTNWGAIPDTPMYSLKSAGENPEEVIEFLEKCLRKANYSDVKGRKIESHIAELKALMQPSADTQEPHREAMDYKHILNNYKLL